MFCVCVFFFKQKTAYEMRISDWSSDVCSSDLDGQGRRRGGERHHRGAQLRHVPWPGVPAVHALPAVLRRLRGRQRAAPAVPGRPVPREPQRSEEHTSELQSLMRISYAVFCLKKKNEKSHQKNYDYTKHNTTRV